jgi:crotonobetainyl-CoA:carnitine CoA-transferase CaiB-like acyl-CoA transferase
VVRGRTLQSVVAARLVRRPPAWVLSALHVTGQAKTAVGRRHGWAAPVTTRRKSIPVLVYVSIGGFGQRPPESECRGFDQTAQAMSAVMSITGTAQTGQLRVGIAVVDWATGVFGASGVLAALYEREKTGVGATVEGSLMQSMLTMLSYQAQKYLSIGMVPGQDGNDHPIMYPQGTFRTGDGAMTLACGNETMWHRLSNALGPHAFEYDERFVDNAARMKNRVELRGIIEGTLAARTTQDWPVIVGVGGWRHATTRRLRTPTTSRRRSAHPLHQPWV